MEYNDMINELNIQNASQFIARITLKKDVEKEIYSKQYNELMINDIFYSNMYKKTIEMLTTMRPKFVSNIEFYKYMATTFAKTYIPAIIREYSITDEKLLNILNNIGSGNNIKIFEKGQAEEFVKSHGQYKINGDVGAFRFREFICFTPDNDSKDLVVSENASIYNAARMLGSMIHETMHLLIDVTKKENFDPNSPDVKTSGGFIMNEGLVEMHSQDFARKYGFIQNPALYYFNNVELCRTLKQIVGKDEFERISFYGDYKDMLSCLPDELVQQYRINERIRYFDRQEISYDPTNIIINDESKTL